MARNLHKARSPYQMAQMPEIQDCYYSGMSPTLTSNQRLTRRPRLPVHAGAIPVPR